MKRIVGLLFNFLSVPFVRRQKTNGLKHILSLSLSIVIDNVIPSNFICVCMCVCNIKSIYVGLLIPRFFFLHKSIAIVIVATFYIIAVLALSKDTNKIIWHENFHRISLKRTNGKFYSNDTNFPSRFILFGAFVSIFVSFYTLKVCVYFRFRFILFLVCLGQGLFNIIYICIYICCVYHYSM